MHSWLSVLLWLLLPLQWAWADGSFVSAPPAPAPPWVQHAHQHGNTPTPEPQTDRRAQDCDICHAHCAMAPPAQNPAHSLRAAAVFSSPLDTPLTSVPARRPERPQWPPLA